MLYANIRARVLPQVRSYSEQCAAQANAFRNLRNGKGVLESDNRYMMSKIEKRRSMHSLLRLKSEPQG